MSTNKYLEKAASLFPSIGYNKTLSKDEKRQYMKHYQGTDTSSLKNFGKTQGANLLTSAGAAAGVTGGMAAGKAVGRVVADKMKNRDMIRGIGKVGPGDFDAYHYYNKGATRRNAVALAGMVAGGIAGSIPGASLLDKIRHNHAKGVMEKGKK